ncbi:MAG: BREX-1 system adenine-specific DNA-methyltransferase PglX [Proteobacteria bacterium]|nr:BREX-1 system adenine-specific DNA-methyltransferase PglX [Pseudomonadota bacterium]
MNRKKLFDFATGMRLRLRETVFPQMGDRTEDVACSLFIACCALGFLEVNGFLPQNMQPVNRPDHFIDASKSFSRWFPDIFRDDLYECVPEDLFGQFLTTFFSTIPRDELDFGKTGSIESIGWMYQYYVSELHDDIIDPLHTKIVQKKDIAIATQVFTTDWIVQYIVENTIGVSWLRMHPDSRLRTEMKYLMTAVEDLDHSVRNKDPKNVDILDPCVGTGHFLVYAFEFMMKMYAESSYSQQDAACEIVHHLYGLDIDPRMVAISRFAIAMTARKYDRSFFDHFVEPRAYAIRDASSVTQDMRVCFCGKNKELAKQLDLLLSPFENGSEFGSLIRPKLLDLHAIEARLDEMGRGKKEERLSAGAIRSFLQIAQILCKKYDAVITNPPYLHNYDAEMKSFLQSHYRGYSADLFSVFMVRGLELCKDDGFAGYMTPNVWMFIRSYERLRRFILENHGIASLIQLAKGSFYKDATVDVCAFTLSRAKSSQNGCYLRLESFKGDMDYQKQKVLEALKDPDCPYRFEVEGSHFRRLPLMPIAFWASPQLIKAFETGIRLNAVSAPKQGLATTNNHRFLRLWHEVDDRQIAFGMSADEARQSEFRWFPYNKGGNFRKWYGNQEYIVDYYHDGEEIKKSVMTRYPYLKSPNYVVKNPQYYFRPSLGWSKISSGNVAFRYYPKGFLFDVSGCSIFCDSHREMLFEAGFLNSVVAKAMLEMISPTVNYEAGHIAALPLIHSKDKMDEVCRLAEQNIEICRQDWDDFETSWQFRCHPLMQKSMPISDAFERWASVCRARFETLNSNEEKLNRIFIHIYGLDKELSPKVPPRQVSVSHADINRDIRSLLSYIVGCLFGRYSPEIPGIVHDKNSEKCEEILMVTEESYPTGIDLAAQICAFIKKQFGPQYYEDNIAYIAKSLSDNDAPDSAVRHYLMSGFYADHLKIYQKRPIYWQFDCRRNAGCRIYVYIHHYHQNTLKKIRTKYIHPWLVYTKNILSELQSVPKKQQDTLQINKLSDRVDALSSYELLLQKYEGTPLDLNDGIRHNYAKFGDLLRKI